MLIHTLEQLNKLHRDALESLVDTAGTHTHLAKMLGIDAMTTKGWLNRGRISKAGAKLVESHPTLGKQFKAVDLRPDLDY